MKKLIIIFIFFFFAPSIYAGQYEGKWSGKLSFCKIDYKKFSGIYNLTIKDDSAQMFQYDISTKKINLSQYKGKYKGKIYGFNKNKLGLNGTMGNVKGKFLSSNTINLIFTDNKNCSVQMTKNISLKDTISKNIVNIS